LISTIDFAKGTITFANYDAFFERYWMEAPGELITSHYADQDGKSIYLKRATSGNYCRKGEEVTFDLKGHNIPMIYDEGEGYLPVKIFADLYLQPFYVDFYYGEGTAYFGKKAEKRLFWRFSTSCRKCPFHRLFSYVPGLYIIFRVLRKWSKIGQNGVSYFLNKLQII